ncbi:MAG TPA: MOSC domain-containing protein [Thermoanaerobaculia bacterium]|nr:MOSC domain-containing protein [Thermoanaerobaculia bacterium]
MTMELGRVRELARYPVKSMAGTAIESGFLGWHGFEGDRRFAFRRAGDDSGFPWLSASRLADLLLYHPFGLDGSSGEPLPTHVRTPDGRELELCSAELARDVAARAGIRVELMTLKHGIFDDAPVSVISTTTIAAIGREAGADLDRRRFRANIVLDTRDVEPFLEDGWVGGTLLFGDQDPRPAVSITLRDLRCVMINLDPETAAQDARVMKAAVRLNRNNAGVYGTVVQTGTIAIGQTVRLARDARQ